MKVAWVGVVLGIIGGTILVIYEMLKENDQ